MNELHFISKSQIFNWYFYNGHRFFCLLDFLLMNKCTILVKMLQMVVHLENWSNGVT